MIASQYHATHDFKPIFHRIKSLLVSRGIWHESLLVGFAGTLKQRIDELRDDTRHACVSTGNIACPRKLTHQLMKFTYLCSTNNELVKFLNKWNRDVLVVIRPSNHFKNKNEHRST